MEAESSEASEGRSFIEHVEVPQSKLLFNLFSNFKHSLVISLFILA